MAREAKRTVKKEEIVSLFDHTQENIIEAIKLTKDDMSRLPDDVKLMSKRQISKSEIIEILFNKAKKDDKYLKTIILYAYLGRRGWL